MPGKRPQRSRRSGALRTLAFAALATAIVGAAINFSNKGKLTHELMVYPVQDVTQLSRSIARTRRRMRWR